MKNAKGYTLKTADFSYTEYLKLKDNRPLIGNMLFDHNNDKDETINLSMTLDIKM